jgi:hypothetical protein
MRILVVAVLLIFSAVAFSQNIQRDQYLEKLGYHKISEEGKPFFDQVTRSIKSRGYYFYSQDYFFEMDNAILEVVFANDEWLPFEIEKGVSVEQARKKLIDNGAKDNGTWIIVEDKYKIRFNGVINGNDLVADVVVGLANDELERRKANQKLVYQGVVFNDFNALNCFIRNSGNENFLRFDNRGECKEGDCIDGEGTMQYENGYVFTGNWKDSIALEGTFTIENELLGKIIFQADIYSGIPNGIGKILYSKEKEANVILNCGVIDQVQNIDFPEFNYTGNVSPDFLPSGLGTYKFHSGRKVDIQRNDYTGKLYGNILFENGNQYTGYFNDQFLMDGRGRLVLTAYQAVIETVFENGNVTNQEEVELKYDNGFRQTGTFDVDNGFSGKVETYYETFDGKYTVIGDFDKMIPVGKHLLKEEYSGKELAKTEYDKNGNIVEGTDLYYGDENSLIYFKLESDKFMVDYQKKISENKEILRQQGYQIAQQFEVEMKNKEYTYTQNAIILLPENSYDIRIFDPSGKVKSYDVKLSRAGEEIIKLPCKNDKSSEGFYTNGNQVKIPPKEENARPGPNSIAMEISATGLESGKHIFYVFVLITP